MTIFLVILAFAMLAIIARSLSKRPKKSARDTWLQSPEGRDRMRELNSIVETDSQQVNGEVQDKRPFGEDITNPDSKTIPEPFHGQWSYQGEVRETIEADRIIFKHSGTDQVVAVRFIDRPEGMAGGVVMNVDPKAQIAIVTRQADGEYALHYRGISKDGAKLVDLESMDMKFDRC
jgi:hypothetical protein